MLNLIEQTQTLPVIDTTAIAKGSIDPTKQVRFEVDNLTTSTTRILTMKDADLDLSNVLLNLVEDTNPQLGGNLDSNGFNIDLGDNERLRLGDSNDASIYFTGTNLIINPGFAGGIIDTQDTDMKTGHIGVGATPSSFLLLNIFRSSTTITTAINGTVIATGAQNQITGLNFSAKWGGTGSVATPVGSLSQSSLAANMPSFGLATVVGADATAGINIAQTNLGSIYTLYGIRGAITTVTTHTAHTFTCASIYGKAIPSFGASATVIGWAGLFDDDVQITADNKLLFDGDTQTKGDTYMVFDSVNNTLDTFINNTEEINLSANQLEFVGGTSRALGWSTSGQLDFKINNASEMRLAANTLTFEAGATDVALDWSTSGQLAFKIGLTNEMRLTANTLTFEAGFSDVSIGWATSGKMDITGNMDCSGYMDAALGFKDNGVQGIDGSFADRTGKIVTVSGGIITSIV